MFAYRLYGLRLNSEIELPELNRLDEAEGCEVSIRSAPAIDVGPEYSSVVKDGAVVLTVPGVARFTMTDGTQMLIEPAHASRLHEVRLYLLGSAFGAILHQRRLLPLHANAILFDGNAAAFLGRSGAGKSTLATWLHDRGHPILSDDVCVVGRNSQTRAMAHRGVPRLRLWRDSLEASGREASDHDRVADFADKYALHTGAAPAPDSAPLRALFLLSDDHAAGADAIITPLTGSEAARALIENTYRGSYVRSLGLARSHFDQCAALAQEVPMFRLSRPWDLSLLDAVCQQVEQHIRSVVVDPDL